MDDRVAPRVLRMGNVLMKCRCSSQISSWNSRCHRYDKTCPLTYTYTQKNKVRKKVKEREKTRRREEKEKNEP